MEPKVIFEDEWMVVINKPAGMVTNKSQTVNEETVQDWFVKKYSISNPSRSLGSEFFDRGGIVHRLDKDTSGILVLARTPESYEGLKEQFLKRTTEKVYAALVHGDVKDGVGELSTPIERNPVDKKKFYVGTDLSRMSITEWAVKRRLSFDNHMYTLLDLTPHTGRTHQLRVHMQYLHHPIVSDPIYGYKKTWKQDLEWCPRLFLHAKYLRIKHPMADKVFDFEIPLSEDLAKALGKLVD